MNVFSSYEAGTFVRERGGSLYVWIEPVGGGGWGTLKVSTAAPAAEVASFARFDAGGFDLYLEEGLALPEKIEISLRRWPRPHVRVRGFAPGPVAAYGGDGIVWWEGGPGGGGGNGGGNGGGG